MNIGFFADCWEPQVNGVIISMKNLQQGLAAHGDNVYQFAPAIWRHWQQSTAVFKQFAVRYPFQKEFYMASPLAYRAVSFARRNKIEIAHGHTEFSLGLMAGSVAKRLSIPYVFTLHTIWKYYTHYLFWGLVPHSILIPIMRNFYQKPDYFIAPTIKMKAYLEEQFDIQVHTTVIPTGLDLDRFLTYDPPEEARRAFRRKYGIGPHDPVMIFVGRMGREKSIDELIDALPRLLAKHPALKLLLVGGGPCKHEFEVQANSLGVREAVVFTGYLPWENLPLAYKAADFFAIASRTESQGLVTVEAQASGLPVIAAEDAANREILGSEKNGLVFHNGDELIHAVDSLLSNPGLARTLSERSRERSYFFTVKEYGARVHAYYQWVREDYARKKTTTGRRRMGKETATNGRR
ncbi:MAG TPA: glycosyltransferase family 4 protein [Spirochaetia bacterium]|nr:glycosyltransferase family 4 protein [Spirochaetia bacterium]